MKSVTSWATMSRPFVVSEQKLAEKLHILRERGAGMLTRIYNIKKGDGQLTHSGFKSSFGCLLPCLCNWKEDIYIFLASGPFFF